MYSKYVTYRSRIQHSDPKYKKHFYINVSFKWSLYFGSEWYVVRLGAEINRVRTRYGQTLIVSNNREKQTKGLLYLNQVSANKGHHMSNNLGGLGGGT